MRSYYHTFFSFLLYHFFLLFALKLGHYNTIFFQSLQMLYLNTKSSNNEDFVGLTPNLKLFGKKIMRSLTSFVA